MKGFCCDQTNKICFFFLGLWICFPKIITLWVATEDILAGSLISTAVVLITFSATDILSKALSPWVVDRISFLPSMILYAILEITSFLLLIIINRIEVRLAGICVLGIGNGIGLITTSRIVAYYKEMSGVFQSGGQAAAVVASLLYTGLTRWSCLSPRIATALSTPLCLLPLVIYALLDKEPLKNHDRYKTTKYEHVNNQALDGNKPSLASSIGQKLYLLYKVFPLVAYCFTSNFLMQLSLTAILSTIAFPSSPFPFPDHYQYYRLFSDIGMTLGGMELVLASFLCRDWLEFFKIRHIWILVSLNVGHVMLFLVVAWYRIITNVYIILVLTFTQAVLVGSTQVHSFATVSDRVSKSREVGTGLGFLEISYSIGRMAAALLGLFVEEYLRNHCSHQLLLGRFCLARLPSLGMWNTQNCEFEG